MHDDLRAKRAQVTHSEVPAELLANSFAQDMEDESGDVGRGHEAKKVRKLNPSTWQPKLDAALKGPLKTAGNPSFTKIMNYVKNDGYSVIHKGSRVCTPNAFLEHVSMGMHAKNCMLNYGTNRFHRY